MTGNRYSNLTFEVLEDDRPMKGENYILNSNTVVYLHGMSFGFGMFFESKKAFDQYKEFINKFKWEEPEDEEV